MKSLVMGLTLCLVHLGARAQEAPPVDVKTRLASMTALADEVIAAGKVGQTGLKAEWRKLKTQAGESAIPVLRMIGIKASAVAADPKMTAEAVAPKVAELSKVTASLAAQGLAIDAEVAAAVGAATGVRQEILQTLQRQLVATETLNEIKAFTAKGNAGWYDGMFPKTAALAERGIEAFNHVFVTSDYAREVRLLAGEGLAQSGAKKYVAGVREVQEDVFEEEAIREKAKVVMARLGDRTLLDKDLEAVREHSKKAIEDLPGLQEKYRKAVGPFRELSAKKEPTEEEKTQLEQMRKEFMALNNDLLRATIGVARAYDQSATLLQNVRDHAKSEEYFTKAVNLYATIAGYFEQNPQQKSTVAISYYNLACSCSIQGKLDRAFLALDRSFRWGYTQFAWAEEDGDLAPLRQDPRWAALLSEVKAGKAKERWAKEPDGMPAGPAASEAKPAPTEPKGDGS